MSDIQIFENPAFGKVRALTIDGEPWFVGRDVASVLGYAKPENALAAHVDNEDKNTTLIQGGNRGNPTMTVINESGLYALILSSKLPKAREFKRWVTSEVLPSIRSHGAYLTPETLEAALLNPDTLIKLATELKSEREARLALAADNAALRKSAETLKDAADYAGRVLLSSGSLTVSQIAADYGLSARRLNEILHEDKIQHKVNGQWILYKEWMGYGLTESVTVPVVGKDGKPGVKMSTRWTQWGRRLIDMVLRRRGCLTREENEKMRRAFAIMFGEDKEGGADDGEV